MCLRNLSRARRTFTFRLILWYSGIFILSASFLFALAYVLLSSSVQRKDREDIHQKLGEYAAQYRTGGLAALEREVAFENRAGKENHFFVRVAGPQNGTIFLDEPESWADFNLQQLEQESAGASDQLTRLQSRDGEDSLEIDSAQLADGVLLQVGKNAKDREKLLERFREIFIGFMVPVVALGIAGGSFLAFRALRPIRSLVNTIRSVSTGRMDARVPARQTGDELDELVVLFNAMLEKIETLIKEMRGSLDNVAHDLRTPLARLRNSAETALRSDQTPETYREALADCLEESDWILTMLNTMMDISEAETGTMKLRLEVVSIPALLEIDGLEEEKDKAAQGGGKEDEGLLRELLRNIEAAPIVTISSGRPVNALTGADESLSRAFPLATRPLGLARNTLRTPAFLTVDFRVVKYISLGGFTPYSASGTRRLDLVVEFFNLFNHPNPVSLNPFYGSGATPLSTFGAPTAFAAPRQVRFSIDFEF